MVLVFTFLDHWNTKCNTEPHIPVLNGLVYVGLSCYMCHKQQLHISGFMSLFNIILMILGRRRISVSEVFCGETVRCDTLMLQSIFESITKEAP